MKKKREKIKNRRLSIHTEKYVHIPHIDQEWIDNKIDGHGGSYFYDNKYSCASIGYIGSTSQLKVFYYNIILWLKYVKRNIKKIMKGGFYSG